MKLCIISFKECWRETDGSWYSSGGFPLQVSRIGALFDEVTMLVVESAPKAGGIRLLERAKIVPLRRPCGAGLRRKFDVLFGFRPYWRVMLRHCREADAIHVPLPGDVPLVGLWVALALRKRVIARYGSSWFTNEQTTWMNKVTKACLRAFAGGRNVMLATGEGEAPPAPSMHWIFATALSDAELQHVRPDLDRELSTPPTIVYVGRLSPEKGVVHLIEAAAVLKQQQFHPMPLVVLAGDGPQRTELERRVDELRCQDVVQFAGQLDRAALSRLLLQSDFCVQPSLTEGYSKAWLDAMAHGLPVLASEVGAARQVIGQQGERGWLVKPGDVASLADAIARTIQAKKDWPALRKRCRAFVEGRTLEAWGDTIGQICAQQWNLEFREGKLR